jgi:hypothetical protein
VGELLSQQSGTFALMWAVGKDGQVKVGLRSQRGYDCSPLPSAWAAAGMRRRAASACRRSACRSCWAARSSHSQNGRQRLSGKRWQLWF